MLLNFRLRLFLFVFAAAFSAQTVNAAVSCRAILSKPQREPVDLIREGFDQILKNANKNAAQLTEQEIKSKIMSAVQGTQKAQEFSSQINENLSATLGALIDDQKRILRIAAASFSEGFFGETSDFDQMISETRTSLSPEYRNQAVSSGVFLDIGLRLERSNQSVYTWEAYRKSYGISDVEGQAISWAYKTFLREKGLRFIVEIYIEKGFLKWEMTTREISSKILFIAAYPEMIAFVDKIKSFNFDSRIPFASPDELVVTSMRPLRNREGVSAALYFWKGWDLMEEGRDEKSEAQVTFQIVKPEEVESIEDTEFDRIQDQESKFIKAKWNKFLEVQGLLEKNLQLRIEGEIADGVIDVSVESGKPVNEVEIMGAFYLFLTEGL